MNEDPISNETSENRDNSPKPIAKRSIITLITPILKSAKMPILFIFGYFILGNLLYFLSPPPDIPELTYPHQNETDVDLGTSLSFIGGNPNIPGIYQALQLAKIDFSQKIYYNIKIYNKSKSLVEQGFEGSESSKKEIKYQPKGLLQQDGIYYWTVSATNGYGKESWSQECRFETKKGPQIDLRRGQLFNDSNGCFAGMPLTNTSAINISYFLLNNGYLRYNIPLIPGELSKVAGLKFIYKGSGSKNSIEVKFSYEDSNTKDTTFQIILPNSTSTDGWVQEEILFKDVHWGWNDKNQSYLGDLDKNKIVNIEFAISNKPDYGDDTGNSSGWIIIDNLKGII